MFFFDPRYFLFLAPALALAFWAQMRVRSTYAAARKIPAPLSGAAAARYVLNEAGLQNVAIEQTPGQLSDHYDPQQKVLRLSPEVYNEHSMAAVGIACHEAGHAIQDAVNYAPMIIRNAAVPAANFGSGFSMTLFFLGLVTSWHFLVTIGIALFACVVFFQVVNLPVEFNASTRAKQKLVALGVINPQELKYVKSVLDAAAWTYVAATLQAIMTLLYLLVRASGSRD
jgi:Zn-dependent membrane protease YugP